MNPLKFLPSSLSDFLAKIAAMMTWNISHGRWGLDDLEGAQSQHIQTQESALDPQSTVDTASTRSNTGRRMSRIT